VDGRHSRLKLSIIVPAFNEEGAIGNTVSSVVATAAEAGIDYELIVVDDSSSDRTATIVRELAAGNERIRYLRSPGERGFGRAVRAGLAHYEGDAVAIVMADGSDDPRDIVTYHELLSAGYDCAFGSRFIAGGSAQGYPLVKLGLNRAFNLAIRLAFGYAYNDTTNAFKAYRRSTIDDLQPLLAEHFNLTVEMPLKAITRGHAYAVTPISWRGRTSGASKLRLQEMGSRYLLVVARVFLEERLRRGGRRTGRRGAD
jgi:dolichol-phosphate mannosyltransferase